jgi:hypothetical protein
LLDDRRIQIRIRVAQKHVDPVDLDPEHWFLFHALLHFRGSLLLTLSNMPSEVVFTIWQGGQLATPVRTTLAKVKTILGADYTPAMPCSV